MTTQVLIETEIPSWCVGIFNEDQEDPDKDPGFLVTARLWTDKGGLLLEGSFMYTGQSDHTIHELACGNGRVHRCTVEWKGRLADATHDMHNCHPQRGDQCQVSLHNLRAMQ